MLKASYWLWEGVKSFYWFLLSNLWKNSRNEAQSRKYQYLSYSNI